MHLNPQTEPKGVNRGGSPGRLDQKFGLPRVQGLDGLVDRLRNVVFEGCAHLERRSRRGDMVIVCVV